MIDIDPERKALLVEAICKEIDKQYEEKFKSEMIGETEKQEAINVLRENYHAIIKVLKKYCDMDEIYYPIISLWIIGTWCHECFSTYPFLFVNAMKSSGKTRLLKLISHLAKDGDIQANISEAVLFRTAKGRTIILDEFEHVGSKEKNILRELLNAAYKKGIKVKRMKKIKKLNKEEQVVEEFDLYTPVCMANIWGMDEVLESRCISIILEKSNKLGIIRLLEDFENDIDIINIKKNFMNSLVSFCGVIRQKKTIHLWNEYINDITTPNGKTTQNDKTTPYSEMFDEIIKTNIDGRNLEIFFPLYTIAWIIGKDEFKLILDISKRIIDDKKHEESIESKDVSLIIFIAMHSKMEWYDSYVSIYEIVSEFKKYLKEDDNEEQWLNMKWMGRALRRLKLFKKKRRLRNGREVILDIEKAKEKAKMFIDMQNDGEYQKDAPEAV